VTLSHATKEHPAQVEKVGEQVNVGKITETVYSGMWTSAQKADILNRVEALLRAFKKARQRANRVDIKDVRAGRKLAEFILSGPTSEKLTDEDSEES
jgi:hypothetical protein